MSEESTCYGCVAQFADSAALVRAVNAARREGYREIDAYTPLPVEGLAEALGYKPLQIPALVLMGGILFGVMMCFTQFYSSLVNYPFNIGGRPHDSWPAFLFIGLEVSLFGGGLFGVIGMLWLSRLPALYHPVFEAADFERASRDGFFLCIRSDDPVFNAARTASLLLDLGALRVEALPT